MTKSQLIDRVADELNITRRDAKHMVDAVIEGVAQALVVDGHLALRGFGTFDVRRRGSGVTEDGEGHGSGPCSVAFRSSGTLRARLEAAADAAPTEG